LTLASGRSVAPGEPIHDMSIRLVVDDDLNVIDIVASTDASPFDICPEATQTLQSMKGLRIGAGWSKAIRERLAGRKGCTHLNELLTPLATIQNVFNTNVFGTFILCREAAKAMLRAKQGRIVNFATVATPLERHLGIGCERRQHRRVIARAHGGVESLDVGFEQGVVHAATVPRSPSVQTARNAPRIATSNASGT